MKLSYMFKKQSFIHLLTVHCPLLKTILLILLFTGRPRSCWKERAQGNERRTGAAGPGPALSRGACYSYFSYVYMWWCVTDSYCWKFGEKTYRVILSGTTKTSFTGIFFPFPRFLTFLLYVYIGWCSASVSLWFVSLAWLCCLFLVIMVVYIVYVCSRWQGAEGCKKEAVETGQPAPEAPCPLVQYICLLLSLLCL